MSLSTVFKSIFDAILRLFGKSGEPRQQFLPCPNEKEIQETQTIGEEGGTLRLGEHRLVLPSGAVGEPIRFTATLLADKTLKLRLQANGEETYQFKQPAALTLSYGRCEPPSDPQRLRILKIDPKTGEVVKDLDGEVNPRERTVTARLETLSIYTLGLPS